MLRTLKTSLRYWLNQVGISLVGNTVLIKLIRKVKNLSFLLLEPSDTYDKIFSQISYSPKVEIALLDVGANIGQTALKFHSILSSKCHFSAYCFEPFSENFEVLKKTLLIFQIYIVFRWA